MDVLSVPKELEVLTDTDDAFRRRVDDVNRYLTWARANMAKIGDETERQSKIRADGGFYAGPGGGLLL